MKLYNSFNIDTLWFKELVKYAVVGVSLNFIGYTLYLLGTYLGAEPKLVMSVLYLSSVTLSFYANRKFTFDSESRGVRAKYRYFMAHCGGFIFSWLLLYFLHDILAYPHQLVQLGAIFVVAIYLFFMLKLWVFK